MFRGLTIAAFLLALAVHAPSRAQTPQASDVPLMGSEAAPGDAVAVAADPKAVALPDGFGGADNLYRILVIGDALAGGFGAGVTRMLDGDPQFEVVNRFNEASGLARPEIYDWADAAPKILAARPYDAVLVHVGVNDRQAIRTPEARLEFRTSEWEQAYKKRIEVLLDGLKALNVKTYWVALPPMADPAFDADMQYLNGLFRDALAAKGGAFLDVRRNFQNPDGSYADRGPDDTGEERKLRARDGITFLKQGNNRMGQLLVTAIKAAEASAAPPTSIAAVAPVLPAATSTTPSSAVDTGVPQFGQQGLDGADMAFTPDAVPKKAQDNASPSAQDAGQSAARPVILTASGSKAELLFKKGVSPDPEPGRFDDFGIVAAP